MPNKFESELTHAQLAAFLEECKAIAAKPTLVQIQAAAKRYGLDVSLMSAKNFRDTTFSAHLSRLAAGREKSAQILNAVREGGAHPLDAVEESAAADLLDAYTSGEEVDTAAIVKIALQLRASIAQRKDGERADKDFARKLSETTAKLQLAEQQLKLRDQQIAKLETDLKERAERAEKTKTALAVAAKKGGITADTRKLIEKAMSGEE